MTVIDARFTARPDNIKVPLYPFMHNLDIRFILDNYKPGSLKEKIGDHFAIDQENILLANSATEALLYYLQNSIKTKLKIALPAFFCPYFAGALKQAQHDLYLYDVDQTFKMNINSASKIVDAKCDMVILPDFWGVRDISEQLVDYFVKNSVSVVIDEAQSFPLSARKHIYKKDLVVLFSFGKNKPLASIGGGGIALCGSLSNQRINLEAGSVGDMKAFISLCKQKIIKILLQHSRKLYEKVYPVEKHLDRHLHKQLSASQNTYDTFRPISRLQESMAYYNWKCLKSKLLKQGARTEILQQIFSSYRYNLQKPYEILMPYPVILSILVSDRYNFSTKMAACGIETTWYYYPLNRLAFFKDCVCEGTTGADYLAQNIIILPFQFHHTDRQFNRLCKALKENPC